MKRKNAKNLRLCEFFTDSLKETRELDLLLTRLFGDVHMTGKNRNKQEWKTLIWVTEEEAELVEELMFKNSVPDWDEEYELLLDETE